MKLNAKFYKEVGIELKRWIKKNFRSQKNAARQLGISESLLSKYIKGIPEPPAKFVTLITDKHGFPKEHFVRYYSLNDYAPEILTKDEMIRLIYEYQLLLKRKDEHLDRIEKQVTSLAAISIQINKTINDLIKDRNKISFENYALKDELNTLKIKNKLLENSRKEI